MINTLILDALIFKRMLLNFKIESRDTFSNLSNQHKARVSLTVLQNEGTTAQLADRFVIHLTIIEYTLRGMDNQLILLLSRPDFRMARDPTSLLHSPGRIPSVEPRSHAEFDPPPPAPTGFPTTARPRHGSVAGKTDHSAPPPMY